MPTGYKHSPETKAAVMHALLAGQSVNAVADQYNIPAATIKTWKRSLRSEKILDDPEKKDELGDLILEYLREALTTLTAQARQFREPNWLLKQDAADVAVLHGVLTDKAIRILSAIEPIEPEATGERDH